MTSTERPRGPTQSRRNRELEAAFDEAPLGMALVALDGRWLWVNKMCTQITGYSREELLDGSYQQITHPEDHVLDLSLVRELHSGRVDRASVEKRYVSKDGRIVWVNLTVHLIRDDEGRPDFYVSVIEDIAERRLAAERLLESESRYRAVFDSALEAIVVIDEAGIVQSANPACRTIFGYEPAEMAGRNVRMLMPRETAFQHDDFLERYRETGKRAIIGIGREVDGRRKDGGIVPVDLSVAEWEMEGRRYYTGIMRDISKRREAEQALSESEERLRMLRHEYAHLARVTELGEMAAAISHEINQPLTAIVNQLTAGTLMLAGARSPQALGELEDTMQAAVTQALRAGEIIRRLREFVGKGSGERRPERVSAIVGAAAGLALIDAAANGIRVEQKSTAGEATVEVDPVQIQQVIVNLIRNAIDALETLPAGHERVLRLSTRLLPETSQIEIRVADTGPGVPPELRPTLFDPFVTTKPDGMGMGLSVCRRLVEAQGGLIELEDSERGASFRVLLPQYGKNGGGGSPLVSS